MTRQLSTVVVAGLLVCSLALAGLPGGAAAASDDSTETWGGWLSDPGNTSTPSFTEDPIGYVTAGASATNRKLISLDLGSLTYKARHLSITSNTSEDRELADEYATETQAAFNENASDYVNYTNTRFSGNASEYDTIKLIWEHDGATATRYLVSDTAGGTFSNATITPALDNRSVDRTVLVEDYAASQTASELNWFHAEYVATDTDPGHSVFVHYRKYGDDVHYRTGNHTKADFAEVS